MEVRHVTVSPPSGNSERRDKYCTIHKRYSFCDEYDPSNVVAGVHPLGQSLESLVASLKGKSVAQQIISKGMKSPLNP